MRACRISCSITAMLLTLGLVTVACSSSDDESGGAAATGGTAGAAGAAGTGGAAGMAGSGATGGTGGTAGTAGTGATGGAAGSGGASITCDGTGFAQDQSFGRMYRFSSSTWIYSGATGGSTYDYMGARISESYGAPTTPGTYTLEDIDESLDTCATCFIMETGCNDNGCSGSYMPMAGGTYSITKLGTGAGDTIELKLDDVTFREVEIADDSTTTDVPNGTHWCVTDTELVSDIVGPHVDIEPTATSCDDYPAAPYNFLGPEEGDTEMPQGTVPPMAWPGAHFKGTKVGLDLAQYRCDHPEIKTLFIISGGGWCPACKQFMEESVCPDGGLEDTLHALNAEILYVWGDNNTPGSPATNEFADAKVSGYGCKGGYRISDTDNSAGARVIFHTPMVAAIPWAAAVRMSDMKFLVEQSEESSQWIDFEGIATANNQ